MTAERIQELRTILATSQHGLEPRDVRELLDEVARYRADLEMSRADVFTCIGLLQEANRKEKFLLAKLDDAIMRANEKSATR